MILIIDLGSTKVPFIEQMVDEFMDYTTVRFDEFTPEKLENIDGIILSGAPILITEKDMSPYLTSMEWIKKGTIPVLGICFGHQLIGMLYGASRAKMKPDRESQLIESIEDSILFTRLPKEFEMMEDHCETISVPSDFNLIAISDACVNEAMQHKNLPLFGVQFHPEISGNLGATVIENFINFVNQHKNGIK